MQKKGSKMPVTVFLAKPIVDSHKNLYQPNPALREEKIHLDGNVEGWLVSKISKPNPPKWVNFFSGYTDIKKLGLNSSTGALFIVKVKERYFLLSFGVAYHQVNFENIERDFGLKTSLNCIDENSIRCVDKSSLEAHPKESREQAGLLTEINSFGIDVERDLLKAVTGTPKKQYDLLGTRITGRDPVKFSALINPGNLIRYLEYLLIIYQSDEYKKGSFSWVDHIGEVKDVSLQEKLNADLITRLSTGNYDRIWTSVPEIVDWENTHGFKCFSLRNYLRHDLKIKELIENIPEDIIDIEILKKRKVYSVDVNGDVIKSWPAYRFLHVETDLNDDVHLLNNGKWYHINRDYSKTIEDFFASIEPYEEEIPEYDDDTETIYNERIARENGNKYILLDKKIIKISTKASPVEPCDLFRYPDEFIHVKRYGGSSVLSHLFNQGLVSGELFKREPDFKEILKEKMGVKYQKTNIDLEDHKFSIIFAIISESNRELSIPFFSKISLKHAANRLTALGYKVFLAKISVAEDRKKVKKYPAKERRIKRKIV